MLNKDPDIVPEEAPLIILDSKSAMCMAKNGNYTKHTRHIFKKSIFLKEWWKVQYAQDWLVWGSSVIGRHCH